MKHALKALAAAATLSLSAGYSHAALYTMNVNWSVATSGCSTQAANPAHYCSGTGIGTGTWDNVTNVLNYTGNETLHIDFNDGNPVSDAVVNRTFTIDTDALTYTYVNNACSDNTGLVCSSFAQGIDGVSRPMGSAPGSTNANGTPAGIGTITAPSTSTVYRTTGFVWNGTDAIRTSLADVQNRRFTFSNLQLQPVNEVPVPAAAWLFGSGLLGLAGTARKRRQAK